MMANRVDSARYRQLSWLLLAGVVMGVLWSALSDRWLDAAVLAGFAALGGGFMRLQDELPRLFTLLFLIAGLINVAGYAFDLWHSPVWFDEVVHSYTSFAVMAAIGWLAIARTRLFGGSLSFVAAVTGVGIILGLLWEVFEWAIGIIGTRLDTISDLALDSLGAVAAGLFCAWAAGQARASPKPRIREKGTSYG